jgi:hypothetical protein
MFLNIMYCQFDDKKDIAILPDMLYGGSWKSSFTGHFPGSSWHSWDAAVVFFVWKNWISLLIGLSLTFGLFWLGRAIRRRQLHGYETVEDDTKEV